VYIALLENPAMSVTDDNLDAEVLSLVAFYAVVFSVFSTFDHPSLCCT